MQQLTNAEEQLMEHLWRKPLWKIYSDISRTKPDHYRGHFTERWLIKILWPILSLVTQRILSISKKTLFLKTRQRIDKEFL
jgi:uncharacterized protein YbcI